MGNNPTDNLPEKCHARRHMDAEFRVYDAMLAICKSKQVEGQPLPTCYAKTYTIANNVDRSTEQVRAAQRKLEEAGWIIDLHPKQQQRQRKGLWSTTEHRVVEHDEYAATHPCPPLRYNPATGDIIKPGEAAPALGRANIRKIPDATGFMATLPEPLAEVLRQAVKEKATATGNPVPVNNQQPPQEILCPTATGNPVSRPQEILPTATGNPVTSLKVQSEREKPETNLPACQPPENGGVDKTAGGRGASSSSPASPVATKAKTKQQLWVDFIQTAGNNLPDEMLDPVSAKPTAEERDAVLNQLAEYAGDVEALSKAIRAWVDNRSMPLGGKSGRRFGRWSCWLEEGKQFFDENHPRVMAEQKAMMERTAKKTRELYESIYGNVEQQIREHAQREIAEREERKKKFGYVESESEEEAGKTIEDYL